MTKIVNRKGFSGLPPESGYPRYFGYHPKIRGISEQVAREVHPLMSVV